MPPLCHTIHTESSDLFLKQKSEKASHRGFLYKLNKEMRVAFLKYDGEPPLGQQPSRCGFSFILRLTEPWESWLSSPCWG